MSANSISVLIQYFMLRDRALLKTVKSLHPGQEKEIGELFSSHLSQLLLDYQDILEFFQSDESMSALIDKLDS